jgi:hypothetical protein
MNANNRIKVSGTQFAVIGTWGERVGTYPTENAAQHDIENCKREDRMYETAKILVDTAIRAHMEMFGADRETTRYWVCSAMDVV